MQAAMGGRDCSAMNCRRAQRRQQRNGSTGRAGQAVSVASTTVRSEPQRARSCKWLQKERSPAGG